METTNLNPCQLAAKGELENWLLDPTQKEFILMGGPGVGKSYVIDNVLNDINEIIDIAELMGVDFHITDLTKTAPTNKAASVIQGKTIYSTLGLSVYNDYKTGEVKLNSRNAQTQYNTLLIVDESSMVDLNLFKSIQKYTHPTCKVLYVLDPDQLPPVKATSIPVIDDLSIPRVEMVTQQRQDPNSNLYKNILNVRGWVRGRGLNQITEGDDVIFIDDKGLNDFISNMTERDKVITYTNESCINLGNHARNLLGLPSDFYGSGEVVTSNSTITKNIASPIYTDMDYVINNIGGVTTYHGAFDYRRCTLGGIMCNIPTNSATYFNYLKQLKREKNWGTFFNISEQFVDVRDSHVISTHKSQGSTYDNVLINLANLNKCKDKDLIPRLLYVAMSRAKHKVYLYGDLYT